MAEEFVRTEHFEEFSRRMEGQFRAVEKRVDQGFTHAAKERENILVHLNQRFDDMNKRFDDMKESVNQRFDDMKESVNQRFDGVNQRFDSLEKMMGWQNRVSMGIFLLILAAVLKYLFFPG